MKRPIGIYLVAAWIFFGVYISFWFPISDIRFSELINNPNIDTIIQVVAFLLTVYLIIGIIKLQSVQRNVSIVIMLLISSV